MKSLVVLCLIIGLAVCANIPNRQFRIANGQIAKLKQFPYQATLSIIKNKNGDLISSVCGGALISSNTILTAAHCLEMATYVFILLGEKKDWSNEATRVMRIAKRKAGEFIVHENYNDTTTENDVALITFSSAVPFNDAIQPVNLPKPDQVNLDGTMAVVAGFGKTGTNATNSKELRFANRKILPSSYCQMLFPSDFQPNMHICLDGSDGIATCQGDSGGPLVIEEADKSKTVVGISSFGDVTCGKGSPTVFTKVTTYVKWIRKHMK